MTTIIVIVVVALVFFVTVCVAAFMVWKKETEMRTDSIRAIENNLERLGDRIGAEPEEYAAGIRQTIGGAAARPAEREEAPAGARDDRDPFSWTREPEDPAPEAFEAVRDSADEPEVKEDPGQVCSNSIPDIEESPGDTAVAEDMDYPEISLDFADLEDAFKEEDILEDSYPVEMPPAADQTEKKSCGYDVGRSGKKYTAEELEMLIKE